MTDAKILGLPRDSGGDTARAADQAERESAEFALKWDRRFLGLARLVSAWSKDPTQVGAVLAWPDRKIAAVGYNGFPGLMPDLPDLLADRDEKLSRTVHAEMNAVLSFERRPVGCTIYTWPFGPCDRCAVHLMQAGVVRFVFPSGACASNWAASIDRAKRYIVEAGLMYTEIGGPDATADAG